MSSNTFGEKPGAQFKNLDWYDTLEKIRNYTTSNIAKDLVAKTAPLKSKEDAQKQASEISQAQSDFLHKYDIPSHI